MARQTGKQQKSGTTRFLLTCIGVGLLLIGLIADIFFASSSRFKLSHLSISTNWPPHSSDLPATLPAKLKEPINSSSNPKPKEKNVQEKSKDGRVLSATFADLPAPELKWDKMASAPDPRLDGAAIQIKNLLYVFA